MENYIFAKATTSRIKKLTRIGYGVRMERDLEGLIKSCPENERSKYREEYEGFLKLFQEYTSRSDPEISWKEINPIPIGITIEYEDLLLPSKPKMKSLLNKLIVVKFNGGLGTRMKCDGPKSLIPVRDGLTFLDLTVQQVANMNEEFNTNVPLILMNSFATQKITEIVLAKYKKLRLQTYTFLQNRYPRIYAENLTLLPSTYDDEDKEAWYPPGHGNFYKAFYASGLLSKLIDEGKEYCFISNIDNLGATVDFRILNIMSELENEPAPDFIMEITKKTAADLKGGTLIYYRDKCKLLEYAEVPKNKIEEFKGSHKFHNFNTNNLWINLQAMKKLVKNDLISMDVIANKKEIIRGIKKVDIIQLETASGGAIQSFRNSIAVWVPRSRFLPVKGVSDLLLLRSNVYVHNCDKLNRNPLRPTAEVPLIRLDEKHFGCYKDLDVRFESIPDCLYLNNLTITGDVYFGKDVVLKGDVTIVANEGERIDIPQGSVFNYNIVTGSLRIA